VPFVLPIASVDRGLADQAGQKCAQLGNLISAGFRVPEGFCILSSGYETFVRENRLQGEIDRFIQNVASGPRPDQFRDETEIQNLFRSAPFPDSLQAEILAAYAGLSCGEGPSQPVAVRSSGSREDGSLASFAGQFDSFLNVRGDQELLDQIKRCWAGFWKARSIRYQMDRCGDNWSSGIAILVQTMIPARLAGVLFSANPITGSCDEMVIEASWGLGEAIVDGTVKPDRFVVDARNSQVIEKAIQDKRFMAVLAPDRPGETRRARVPKNRQSVPCLTDEEIQALVCTGRSVHEHFGCPQDIEWAFHRRVLYLLQARPITTLPPPGRTPSPAIAVEERIRGSEFDTDTAPGTEWTSSAIRDMLPGVLSPLTISQMSALEYGFRKPQQELGLMPRFAPGENRTFLGFFYNRAHLNMTLIRTLIRQVPLVSSANLERLLQDPSPRERGGTWAYARFALDIPNMMRVGMHALEVVRKREPEADALLSSGLQEYAEEQRTRRIASLANGDLIQRMVEIQGKLAEIYAMHITASQFGEVTFQLLRRAIRRWTRDEYGHLASQLVSGSSTPLFAKPIAELWGLAQQVRGNRNLEQIFSRKSIQTGWQQLASDRTRSARQFNDSFQTFLSQYGYRSRYGAELMHPSWDGEPIFILSLVRIYSRLLLTLNPWEKEREQAQRRLGILRRLESHLNPLSKRVLHELLKLMHALIPLRQNMRALSLMQAHLSRRLVRQMESQLLREGVVAQPDDVFFLTLEELYDLLQNSSSRGSGAGARGSETRKRIQARKNEFHRNQAVELPAKFHGRPEPLREPDPAASRKPDRRLRGIPASPGRVTGHARRITAPVQEVQVRPGEILILPGMDPGWTPLFPAASAIVAERGGMLSHGSILAREFGIPAVTSIPDATQVIRTGQVITVDGERGEVWL